MSQQTYDPGSKWLIGDRGPALLWVAGLRGVLSCEAEQAEVVQPRKLPDGLLRAVIKGHPEPLLVLVEIATYPEPRVVEQMCGGLRLVRQVRGVLPDAVVLCLAPKGAYRIPDRAESASALGLTGEMLRWRVVNLWVVPAEDLLAAPDVGAVPWATLGRWTGSPEVLLQRCKDRIEAEGRDRRKQLLAVTQVFARMHFDAPGLLSILGERSMILRDMPAIQELEAEFKRENSVELVEGLLHDRFGPVEPAVSAGLKQVVDRTGYIRLAREAVVGRDLASFKEALAKEMPQPRAASTRGKRKK